MDELEKKELEKSNDASPADELVKELEEIRDMFQEAIDNAYQEADEGEVIQELEEFSSDIDEVEEEVVERPVCECCGERPSSAEFGEDYPYCAECRELMKHYPLRIGGVIAVLMVIVIFAVSAYTGFGGLEKAITVLEAQTYSQEGKMLSTLNTLYDYIADYDQDSKKVSELLVDSFCRSGYINDAKTYIENAYTKDELNSPFNKKYKEIVEKTDIFIATQEATQEIIYEAFRGADFDYEELAAKLDEVKESYLDEEKGIRYSSALTEFYKAELMALKKMSLEEQLEVLKGIEENDEDEFYAWVYYPELCELAAKMGDKALADEYFEKAKKLNSEDSNIYKAYASYYRFLEAPDADGMISVAEEAEKNLSQGDISYYSILAAAYLIKGEGTLALETMREYMNSSRYSVSDCNLYALCALFCGNTEVYDQMKATLENSGYSISKLVEQYKNDEISVAEVLADMGGDL